MAEVVVAAVMAARVKTLCVKSSGYEFEAAAAAARLLDREGKGERNKFNLQS